MISMVGLSASQTLFYAVFTPEYLYFRLISLFSFGSIFFETTFLKCVALVPIFFGNLLILPKILMLGAFFAVLGQGGRSKDLVI